MAFELQQRLLTMFNGKVPPEMTREVQNLEFILALYKQKKKKQEKQEASPSLQGGAAAPSGFVDVQLSGKEWATAFVAPGAPMAPGKYLCAWVPDTARFGPSGYPQGDRAPMSGPAPVESWTHRWGDASDNLCSDKMKVRGCRNRSRDVDLYSKGYHAPPPVQPLAYFTLDSRTMKHRPSKKKYTRRRAGKPAGKGPATDTDPPEARLVIGDRIKGLGRVVDVSGSGRVTLRRKGVTRVAPLHELLADLESGTLVKRFSQT